MRAKIRDFPGKGMEFVFVFPSREQAAAKVTNGIPYGQEAYRQDSGGNENNICRFHADRIGVDDKGVFSIS